MNKLIIDTATGIEIAAACSGETYSAQIKQVNLSHSVTLFESIDYALKDSAIDLKDINLLGVGIGPGSFTGIRLAVTTARMFAQIYGLPLVGLKTHLLFAVSAGEIAKPGENILVAFDAKKERVFGSLYKRNNDVLNPVELVSPGDYSIEYLLRYSNTEENTILIGDGCIKYYNTIKPAIKRHDLRENFLPNGKLICNLVEKIYLEDNERWNDYNKVLPFYARKSDAEVLKDRLKR